MTYAEIIYICTDLSKSMTTDDAFYTEDHVRFLINKHRTQLLYEKYKDVKKQIPYNNYQTIHLKLENVYTFDGEHCAGGEYLASIDKIPVTMTIGTMSVYPIDYYNTNITFISRDRMKYVGHNKYLQNIIYCSIGADNKLYFKSNNPQHKYLTKVNATGIFEDVEEANKLMCNCDDNGVCDPFNQVFPLEEELVPTLIQMVVQELTGAAYKPVDSVNNASDDLSDLIAWARQNMKSGLQKQIEG